jgi:hypothetical protein
MKTSARRIFLFAVPALAMVIPTLGDIIFTNFGPGDTYNQSSGGTLTGSGFGGPNEVAVAFKPAVSEFLSTIELPVGAIIGNELDVSLDSSLLGAPGGLIESFHFSGAMGPFGSDVVLTANSALHPLLSAGTQYWVVASVPSASGDFAAWNLNSIGGMTTAVQGSGSGFWAPLGFDTPTMRVTGTDVPEPSSIVLLCSVLVAGIALRKRLPIQPPQFRDGDRTAHLSESVFVCVSLFVESGFR